VGGEGGTDEAVALGAAGELVGDDDGLEDVAVALEVLTEGVLVRLPREPADEHLGQRGVAEPRRHRRRMRQRQGQGLRLRRHHRHRLAGQAARCVRPSRDCEMCAGAMERKCRCGGRRLGCGVLYRSSGVCNSVGGREWWLGGRGG
jgi:hypothetical protein